MRVHSCSYSSQLVTPGLDNKLQMILGVSNTAGNFGLTYLAAKAGLPRYTYFLELGSNSRLSLATHAYFLELGSNSRLRFSSKIFLQLASNSRLRCLAPKLFLESYLAPNDFWS